MNQPVNVTPQPQPVPPAQPIPAVGYSPAAPIPRKPIVPSNGKDKLFAFIFFVFSVLFCDMALYGGLNFGFTIVTALFFILMTVYLFGKGVRFKLYPFLCGMLGVAGVVPFALHNDSLVRFVSFVSIGGLFLLYGIHISDSGCFSAGSFRSLFDVVKHGVAYPFRFIGAACSGLWGKPSAEAEVKKRSTGKIVIGIVCTLPVLAIVLPLMVRSNVYFEQLLQSISIDIGRLILCVIFGFLVIPFLFSLLFAWKKGLAKPDSKPAPIRGGIDPIIVQSFLTVLALVDLVYMLTQTAYFFSAFHGLLPEAYAQTVADYARRGFFEMCAIAAIHLLILFLTMLLVKKKQGRFPLITRLLSSFLSLFTILLIGTALSKMFLYIERFGLTRLRVITSVFMVFLVFVFVAVSIRLFVRKFPYMKVIVLAFCLVGLAVSYCDIDTTVARYNVEAYQSGKLDTVDVETLSWLSDGAVPYLVELAGDKDPGVAQAAHIELVYLIFDHFEVECECGDLFCPHTDAHYYTAYGEMDYDDYGEKPVIVTMTPYEETEDYRAYNRDKARAQKLLKDYAFDTIW